MPTALRQTPKPSSTPRPSVTASQTQTPSPSATPSPSPSSQPVVQDMIPTNILIPAGPNWDQLDTIVYPKPSTKENWGVPSDGDLDTVPGRPSYGQKVDPVMAVTWWSNGPKPIGPVLKPGDLPPVMLGHTEIGDSTGAFKDLPKLTDGSSVTVSSITDGSQLKLKVIQVITGLKKDTNEFNIALASPPPGAVAALGTCSGGLRADQQSHEDNTLVWLGFADQPTSGR